MTWNPWSTPLDRGVINGIWTPGILRLRNADSPRKWDERVGYGWSGSFPVFLGVRLSQFDVGFELYTDEDWADWQKLRPILAKPPYGKRPKALDFVHPILQDLDIKSIVVTNVKQQETSELGVITIPIEVMTFRVPKIALAKPEGSADKPKPDWAEQMMQDLQAKIERESAEP